MGGDKLKTLSLTASLQQYDPGESYSLSDPAKPDTGVSDLKQSRDFQRGLTRDEWVRPKADDGTKRTYTEIVTPAAGYVIGNDATNGRLPKRTVTGAQPEHTMSGRRLTATLRELERPFIILEMKRHADRVTAIVFVALRMRRRKFRAPQLRSVFESSWTDAAQYRVGYADRGD